MKFSKLKPRGFAAIRAKLGLSQQDLAQLLRISKSAVGLAETGRRSLPTAAVLKLAKLEIKIEAAISSGIIIPQKEKSISLAPGGEELSVEQRYLTLKLKLMRERYDTVYRQLQLLDAILKKAGDEPGDIFFRGLRGHRYRIVKRLATCDLVKQISLQNKLDLLYAKGELKKRIINQAIEPIEDNYKDDAAGITVSCAVPVYTITIMNQGKALLYSSAPSTSSEGTLESYSTDFFNKRSEALEPAIMPATRVAVLSGTKNPPSEGREAEKPSMKNKLQFTSVLLVFCIFFLSCTNKEKDKDDNSKVTNRVLKVDCESMLPKCGNQPGLKFYGERLGMWRESADGEGDYERVPYDYVVCCEYLPDLIDTLKKADSLRQAWIRDKPERMASNFAFGGADDSIYVSVYYKNRWSDAEPDPFFYLSFGNPAQAPTFYISLKEFDQLLKDIEERFRTCCLK